MQDLARQTRSLSSEVLEACQRVVGSGWFVLGKEVEKFEKEFAEFLGIAHCVTNANGTDSLELALRAVGVALGDEVILAANAGMYATVAILAIGAMPIYAEISADTYSLCPSKIASNFTKKTRAVILTHLYGGAGAVEEIAQQCAHFEVPLIEDCAEAHGARVRGRAVGTWGAVGCFSFYPTKNLGAIGDGGACVTGNADSAKALKALRQYGWESRYHATVPGGRNSRLDEIQAAVLRCKLPHLNTWNQQRREIAQTYNAAFEDLPELKLPIVSGEGYVGHLYVVTTPIRERLRTHLKSVGVSCDIHFPLPDYAQPAIRPRLDRTYHLPETERGCAEVLSLPCFPELQEEELDHVVRSVRAGCEAGSKR